MSQAISIVNKPCIESGVIWRRDGERDQLIILTKDDLALPFILNPTAARIFSLCNGKNSIEDIARILCEEYGLDDFKTVLEDAKKQLDFFIEKNIIYC